MDRLITSQEELCRYMPNVVFSVDGESDLFEKTGPYLEAQQTLLELRVFGAEVPESEPVMEAIKRAVVAGAMAAAVPALDVVLTPNGFGVVSTSEVVPASKERVQALARSLRAARGQNIDIALGFLRFDPQWRATERGHHFCDTLIERLSEAVRFAKDENQDLLEVYDHAREIAALFQEKAASRYLGHAVLREIVEADINRKEELYNARTYLALAERRYITEHWNSHEIIDDFKADLWRICQPVINAIRQHPTLSSVWAGEMPEVANPQTFENDVKGAFYF